ncbi:helicase-associated domain-containing protein [Leucobacter denitrificans]|uniref:Helicase-associated domain-containing protein n=1 Tax=Leucobacter denitrificans TaxID=683042 RepID=A0A7G9S3Y5_9MICO|nr:helicase-associated domain-containing protein [Leucobacter denitrificans]QNN62560.1 helicase-associated domain-containing protein [Leucobacter denitrificans]
MSGTLPLSSYIASLDRVGLMGLVSSRRIASPQSVSDSLDLAQELLKPDSIAQALTELTRDELGVLARISGLGATAQDAGVPPELQRQLESLIALGLVSPNATPFPEVVGVFGAEIDGRVSLDALADPQSKATEHDDAPAPDVSGWFAQALTASGQVAWLLRDLARTPAKLNRNGDVAAAWVKGLEERLSIPRGAELVDLVRGAGLAGPAGHGFVATADAWLGSGHEARWIALARTAAARMPQRLLDMLDTAEAATGQNIHPALTEFPHRFPLATETTLAQVAAAAALWERLGITVHGHLSAGGAYVLRNPVAPGSAEALPDFGFPAIAPGIYIQPDLSVIVPGPLAIADETALAAITLPEQLGVASTLRITEASLGEAIDRGFEAAAIRDMLTGLTVSGIPQPLDYLITALGERAGSVIVTANFSEHGRSRVDFASTALRNSILVDRRLAHLQLAEPSGRLLTETTIPPLYSRLRADHVLAALLDARYPAKTETQGVDDDTRPIMLPRGPAKDEADPLDSLVDRVLASTADSPSDISRQITLAIRDRSSIRVTVEIRGEVRDFSIVPISLASGRMRALDEAAGVERTLPLEAITAVAQLT